MLKSPRNNIDRFQTFVMAVLLIVLLGWLLEAGKGIALPILAAIMWVYIINGAAKALGHVPLIKYLPLSLRRILVFIGFAVGITIFGGVAIVTVEQIIEAAPIYQNNLEQIFDTILEYFGVENRANLPMFQGSGQGQLKFQQILSGIVVSLGSISGVVALVLLYATFLVAESQGFAAKLTIAMPSRQEVKRTQAIMQDINRKIGNYLAAKTLINIILAVVSYLIMWAFDVEFAIFWALLIGLLNYIPYIGSLLAVLFPVILTLAQTASVEWTIYLATSLMFAQWLVGNILEPRIIGKQVNLSPFVVIVSLSIWYALLGVGGAILAVPLTSMLAIILAAFAPTKPIAILLAQDITAVETPHLSNKKP